MKNNVESIQSLLVKNIQNYFDNNYSGINIIDIYGKYMRIKYNEHRFIVNLSLPQQYQDKDSKTILNYILTQNSIRTFLKNASFWDKNSRSIEFWGNSITYFNDRLLFGFYDKSTSYAEFLMDTNLDTLLIKNICKPREILLSFIIKNKHFREVSFELSYPTSMFKLFFESKDFTLWEHNISLKITNVYRNELNKYLHQFIFINNIYNTFNEESLILFAINKTYKKHRLYLSDEKVEPQAIFPEATEIQPLIFYNSGLFATEEEKFLNYYKVLEYFFYRNKQNQYNINNKIRYKTERECLKTILSDLNSKCNNSINEIINNWDYRKVYPNNCDKYDNIYIFTFTQILYDLRCRIVHAKDTKNLLVHSTSLIDSDDSDYIEIWNEIIQKISLICIKCYCYKNINFKKLFNTK